MTKIKKTKYFIYNAGPLYYESEQLQRINEGKKLRKLKDVTVFNPMDQPMNLDKSKKPTPLTIYTTDKDAIDKANVFFFDLAENDTGTSVELGMVLEKLQNGQKLLVYCVYSHIENGYMNVFKLGGVQKYDIPIFRTFDEALNQFKKDIKQK